MEQCNRTLSASPERCGLPKNHERTGVPQRVCLQVSATAPRSDWGVSPDVICCGEAPGRHTVNQDRRGGDTLMDSMSNDLSMALGALARYLLGQRASWDSMVDEVCRLAPSPAQLTRAFTDARGSYLAAPAHHGEDLQVAAVIAFAAEQTREVPSAHGPDPDLGSRTR
ncbi:hypothetical protein GCM10027026_13150 [Myroides odoratimimus subsp. xuanwuensis]